MIKNLQEFLVFFLAIFSLDLLASSKIPNEHALAKEEWQKEIIQEKKVRFKFQKDSSVSPAKYGEAIINVGDMDFSKDLPDGNYHTLLKEYNKDTGEAYRFYSTRDDTGRMSLYFHLAPKATDLSRFMAGDISYGYQISSAHALWLEFIASFSSVKFNHFSRNKDSSAGHDQYPIDLRESLFSLGVGPSFRFHFLNALFENLKVFETLTTYAIYHTLKEEHTNQNFFGPGLRNDFKIHRRMGSLWQFGLGASYNLGWVKRTAKYPGQPSAKRSINLAWFSILFEVGFYF